MELFLSFEDCLNIAAALHYSSNPRFKEVILYTCKNYSYVTVWHEIYELLANIKDEEVEVFFADYLVRDDKNHPNIKKIIEKIAIFVIK